MTGIGEHGHPNRSRLLYGWYFWGLLLATDPWRKITSGSYPPGRSVQRRAATRNSCAKLASISLTFSLTVNPFLLSFSRCFFEPFCSPTLSLRFLSFPSACHRVWSHRLGSAVWNWKQTTRQTAQEIARNMERQTLFANTGVCVRGSAMFAVFRRTW